MKTVKKIKFGIGAVFIVIIVLFLHFNLPRTAVVQIFGTDTKRIDKDITVKEKVGEAEENVKETLSTDVRFINSESRTKKPMVFRNEDTGWGWPPYFKFDSADLTAEAQAFATDQKKPWVRVKYYGWRLAMFSMFPNVLDLKEVDQDYTHIPVFNIIFFILLFVLAFVIKRKFRKLFTKVDKNK